VPVWNGSAWTAQKIVNAQIDPAAAIAYSKLNLAGSVLGSDLSLPYANYTPTWTSSGTAPAIGNAAVVGRYVQIDKVVHCYGRITFGSTSTFGTGVWSFALPVAASANAITAQLSGAAFLYDSSANAMGIALAAITSSLVMTTEYPATWLGTLAQAGQLTPWTWATGDIVEWNTMYEAA